MRPYELVIIFDADLDEETIRSVVDRAVGHIRERGGEVGPVDHWGKRRFAYELKHRWEGYYVVLTARAEPEVLHDLGRMLSLSDEVLRHRLVRVPDEVVGNGSPQVEPAEA